MMYNIEFYEVGDWKTESTIEEQEHQRDRVVEEIENIIDELDGFNGDYQFITKEGTRLVIETDEIALEDINSIDLNECAVTIEEYEY